VAKEGFASAQGAGKGSGEDGLADLWGAGEDDHAVIRDEVGNEPVGLVSGFVLLWLAGTLKENGSHTLWGRWEGKSQPGNCAEMGITRPR